MTFIWSHILLAFCISKKADTLLLLSGGKTTFEASGSLHLKLASLIIHFIYRYSRRFTRQVKEDRR